MQTCTENLLMNIMWMKIILKQVILLQKAVIECVSQLRDFKHGDE